MSDSFSVPTTGRRQLPEDYVADRQVSHLVHPFTRSFEDWNHRAARAGATISSHLTTEEEKTNQRAAMSRLREEVEAAYRQFQTVVADQPRHSRVADVDAAFERLQSILEKAGR